MRLCHILMPLMAALVMPAGNLSAEEKVRPGGTCEVIPLSSDIEVRDIALSRLAEGLSLEAIGEVPWPGITLKAGTPAGIWDLSAREVITLPLRNTGNHPVTMVCRVENPGQDGQRPSVETSLTLAPGASADLTVKLSRAGDTLGGKLFGMKGYPGGSVEGRAVIDPSRVSDLLIFMDHPRGRCSVEIGKITARGDHISVVAKDAGTAPFFPFVDTYGQYRHREWPGKIHSREELDAARKAEESDLALHSGSSGRDQYGGWSDGPQLKATGYFRTEKTGGKWWLVDPEGRLFFSHGIDCVMEDQRTPVEERESWFQDFPGNDPAFGKFTARVRSIMGHYAGRMVDCFSFMRANLLRKYGPDWKEVSEALAQRRLRSWGMNTIGNWSSESCRAMRKTPYVDQFSSGGGRMIAGSGGYWGQFPDVFDPGFASGMLREMEARNGRSAGDPWCVGFFSDNELSWGDDVSLTVAVLKSPSDQPAKKVFMEDLHRKYGGIGALNAVWGTSHNSWEELLSSRDVPDVHKARTDLISFSGRIAETYFATARDAVRSAAPGQLYLGCRFAGSNDPAVRAAAKFCDVVSYNFYRRSIADFRFPGGDKPLLVGEFHFGALDRGLFHPGLVPVSNQEERARAYHDFVMGAVRHPLFVGTHWFQWSDQPVTGRALDGENYQIGFLDVADTPYPSMIEASRRVADEMYRVRAGDPNPIR
jgi:hypothetical protein